MIGRFIFYSLESESRNSQGQCGALRTRNLLLDFLHLQPMREHDDWFDASNLHKEALELQWIRVHGCDHHRIDPVWRDEPIRVKVAVLPVDLP